MPISFCLFCSSKTHLQTFACSLLTSLEKSNPCAISLVDVLPALSFPGQNPFPHAPCPCCQPGMVSLVTDWPRPGLSPWAWRVVRTAGSRWPCQEHPRMGQWEAASPSSATAWWGRGKQLGRKQRGRRRQAVLKGREGNLPLTKKLFVVKEHFPVSARCRW